MEITICILRVFYILFIILDVLLIVKKIVICIKKEKNAINYSNWIFFISILIAMTINFTFFMTDVIGQSWNDLSQSSFIMLIIFSCLNPFITLGIYIGTCKRLVITEESFIIYKLFSKRIIYFKNINILESKYIFKFAEGNKILPKKGIFNSNECLCLKLKTEETLKINFNFLLFSGAYTELYLTVIKKLNIKRVSND